MGISSWKLKTSTSQPWCEEAGPHDLRCGLELVTPSIPHSSEEPNCDVLWEWIPELPQTPPFSRQEWNSWSIEYSIGGSRGLEANDRHEL